MVVTTFCNTENYASLFCFLLDNTLTFRKDVRLPIHLQRAMATEAEAAREARAKVKHFNEMKFNETILRRRKVRNFISGYRSRRRTEGLQRSQGGGRGHPAVPPRSPGINGKVEKLSKNHFFLFSSAPVSPDSQLNISRTQLNYPLPDANDSS